MMTGITVFFSSKVLAKKLEKQLFDTCNILTHNSLICMIYPNLRKTYQAILPTQWCIIPSTHIMRRIRAIRGPNFVLSYIYSIW
jgi:hypothetical protein